MACLPNTNLKLYVNVLHTSFGCIASPLYDLTISVSTDQVVFAICFQFSSREVAACHTCGAKSLEHELQLVQKLPLQYKIILEPPILTRLVLATWVKSSWSKKLVILFTSSGERPTRSPGSAAACGRNRTGCFIIAQAPVTNGCSTKATHRDSTVVASGFAYLDIWFLSSSFCSQIFDRSSLRPANAQQW